MPARKQNKRNDQGIQSSIAPQQAISKVIYAEYEIAPWYSSYYQGDVVGKNQIDTLYICTHCFKYTNDVRAYATHVLKTCEYKDTWPGWVCYSKNDYEIFEVDGDEHLLFAQNLSLFGKLFIENKSVCFDVSGFIFYILVEKNQIVGFFSKEKLSWDNNNLACILVFPPFQGRGNGKKLMAASYVMSKREGRLGGPERPLSEPGRKSYEAFWARAVAELLLAMEAEEIAIKDICDDTYIVPEDVSSVLVRMGVNDKGKDGSIRVSKSDIREWVSRCGLDMRPPLDADGFLDAPGYGSDSTGFKRIDGEEHETSILFPEQDD